MVAPTQSKTALSPQQQEHAAYLQDLVTTAVTDLASQLADGHTDDYLALLAFYQRFWRYSARNLVLIQAQRPDATRVAGYRTWQRLGRQVAKGATAIWIWCPLLAKEHDPETGEEEQVCLGFRPGAVFDAADLVDVETNPLPTLWQPLPDDCGPLYQRVAEGIAASGIPVVEEGLPLGVQGRATAEGITISQRVADSRNRLATVLHEYAHVLAHFGPAAAGKDRWQCELEAESASYVALHHLGIGSPFARDYLLHGQVTPARLYQSLTAIQAIVRRLLLVVEPAHGRHD